MFFFHFYDHCYCFKSEIKDFCYSIIASVHSYKFDILRHSNFCWTFRTFEHVRSSTNDTSILIPKKYEKTKLNERPRPILYRGCWLKRFWTSSLRNAVCVGNFKLLFQQLLRKSERKKKKNFNLQ